MADEVLELINSMKEAKMAEQKPIIVNPSAVQDGIVTGLRYLATIVGGVSAVFGLASKGDLQGLIAYFQGTDGLALIGAAVAVGSLGYGAWKAYSNKNKLVTAAESADDSVAVVATPSKAKEMGLK